MKIQDFVVLDLETTGLSVKEDQILEIGAVKVQGGEVTASYETFVNPGRKVPERITELTGIRDEMIADAPDVETAVRGFLDFCGGLPLLGHNILFDYSFIKQAAINARLDFEKEAWDTLKIARKALPDLESRSLEALCGYYQIPREHAHRAMDDVLETLALFRKLEEGFSEDHPEWFAAAPLKAKMKREVPATEAQKKYLADLIRYHELDLEPEWGALTKSRASRMIDLTTLRTPIVLNGCETKTLLKESITAMALPDHPLFAERDTLSLTELAEQPLILSNRYRKYMLSAFEQAGLFCDIYLTCEDARTAMTMAEKGLGIALLPASMLPLSHQLKACAITDADLTTEILLAWRKGRLPSELRDFLKMWNET